MYGIPPDPGVFPGVGVSIRIEERPPADLRVVEGSKEISTMTAPTVCPCAPSPGRPHGAARAPAGLERDEGWSAGPAGGRAARGERSEPP